MKTFFNLIQEVQKPGLCHRCGGCVTFCTAVNYGALDLDEQGNPYYSDIEKCIECGLCHAICPEIDELDEEAKRMVSWSAPVGRIMETTVARATDAEVRSRATDGGAVTAMLLHLLDTGRIDGAVVTRPINLFQREPFLAMTADDIYQSAGFQIDTSHGMKNFSDRYLTYSSIEELGSMMRKGLRRVAFIGTPCQVKAIRKMQALQIVPSESIQFCLGLFCSGNFVFDEKSRSELAQMGGFDWENVVKLNIKESFQVHLDDGVICRIPLDRMDFMKRQACRYCPDYSAEFADLAFGGVGAEEGWTTVVARTPVGRAALADARGKRIEDFDQRRNRKFVTHAFERILDWSERKKRMAEENRKQLGRPSVQLKS